MSYLGSNEAAFRLGNQAVSVYLGAVEVYSPSATLYFNGAIDGNWSTLGNWWLNASHTVAATALPTAADSVIATATISSNSGSEPTVVNFTMGAGGREFVIGMTVTGIATFGDSDIIGGTITGNANFTDSAYFEGTVTGNATFSGGSGNAGTVTGTATFTGFAYNDGGTAGTFVPDPPPEL